MSISFSQQSYDFSIRLWHVFTPPFHVHFLPFIPPFQVHFLFHHNFMNLIFFRHHPWIHACIWLWVKLVDVRLCVQTLLEFCRWNRISDVVCGLLLERVWFSRLYSFLLASTHLYIRVCLTVRRSVHWSGGPSFSQLVYRWPFCFWCAEMMGIVLKWM